MYFFNDYSHLVACLLLIIGGHNLSAQTPYVADPATGSGASAIIAAYDFGTQTPTLTDPCTCADDFRGKSLFDDEIIVISFNRTDRWFIASQTTGACRRGTDDPIAVNTPIPLVAAGVQTPSTDSVFIFSLPISHEAGRGYEAAVMSGAGVLLSPPIANTCTKVATELGFDNTIPLGINTPIDLQLRILNSTTNVPINPNQKGELGQIFVGTASNPTRILVDRFDAMNIPDEPTFDPSGLLAIGGFNPLLDTIITFRYDADTSYMAGLFVDGGGLSPAIRDNPGCVDSVSTSVVWSTCNGVATDYHVGENNAKYNNEDRTFILCPDDPRTQRIKLAFAGRFDIAAGDVLTIYEGIGTSGLIRDQLTSGGNHASTNLRSTWFQADCSSDNGCLTVTFKPNDKEDDNGTGFQFTPSCETRPAVVTCPSDTIVAGACNLNNSNSVGSLHKISAPVSDCNYEPVTGIVIVLDDTGTELTTIPQSNLSDLDRHGEYLDLNEDGFLDTGETIFLEMGRHTITYRYDNLNPIGNQICEYDVRVGEIALTCNNQINISLSSNGCATVIEPDMLIEGDACNGGFTVNILDGGDKGKDVITYSNVGKKIRVEVVAPSGNRCWGVVLVEDKAPPIFPCQPDTALFCGIPLDPDVSGLYPAGGQDCSPFSYIFSDSEQTPFGCERLGIGNAPDTIGMMIRIWRAVDEGGMMSPPCEQNIYLLKPKLTAANLVWPKDTILYCNNNPDTEPVNTGFPGVKLGNDTVPLSHTCFFGIDYRDIIFDTDCEGVQKIQRTWSILDWCSSGSALAVIQDLDPQIIKVLDTIGPVISNFPDTLVYTIAHDACSADVQLPAITVADDCSPTDAVFRILGGHSSTIYNQAGVMRNVPFGTHEFTYIAEDGCGNQQRQSISLTIKDQTPPTVIAREISVALISDTDLTWVYASSFDGGSHDNCSIASILARKMGDVTFTDAVGFTCEDIGRTVMVELQATDEYGNIGRIMREVDVTDELGVCECNMNAFIEVFETSGINPNDSIICQGDRVMLLARDTTNEAAGGGSGDNSGEGQSGSNTNLKYSWSTGDTVAKITFNPTTSKDYTVTITDDDIGCEVVKTIRIEVSTLPSAAIIVDGQAVNNVDICARDSVELLATGGTDYLWSPAAGLSNPTIQNPIASPNTTTTYMLLVTNDNGCTAIDSVRVTVNDIIASAGLDRTICSRDSVELWASGGTDYLWRPATGLNDSTIQNPIASPMVTTTYVVQISTGSGCSAIATQKVTVNTVLEVNIVPNTNKSVVCTGEEIKLTALPAGGTGSYKYEWSTGIEDTSMVTVSPTINASMYFVTVTDDIGCTARATYSVTVNPTLTAQIMPPSETTICRGDAVVLKAVGMDGTPDYTYKWSSGGETTDSIIVKPTVRTSYGVTIEDACGFIASDMLEIMVDTVVMPNIMVQETSSLLPDDGIICKNDTVLLIATGGDTYSWNIGSENDSLFVMTIGTYKVTITDENKCSVVDSVDISVEEIMFNAVASQPSITVNSPTRITINPTSSAANPNYCYDLSLRNSLFSSSDSVTFFTGMTPGIATFDIIVEDKNNKCKQQDSISVTVLVNSPQPIQNAALSGTIATEAGELVEHTTINIGDYEMPPSITGASGIYQFEEVPMYDNYTVTPEKNRNPLNGVSTYDLVLLSKHILGVEKLTSPYKQIAADVNRSGTITAYDMVQLRRLILNLDTVFPNNQSWRFVDAAYTFSDPTNPLIEVIPESYQITDLTQDMTWLDFVAIKIGDLNNSARPSSLIETESRTATELLEFQVQQELSEDGQSLIFHFTAADFQAIEGYQFTVDFDPSVLSFEKVLPTNWVGEEHFGLTEVDRGWITTSWNTASPLLIGAEEPIFSLAFQLTGSVQSDQLLTISSAALSAEAYNDKGELLDIELAERQVVPEVATKQIELYQNRPNPFTGKTTIGFNLPEAMTATLRIFDTNGKVIQVYPGKYEAGYNELIINSKDLTQYGALYYQLATTTQIATKKMIHLK